MRLRTIIVLVVLLALGGILLVGWRRAPTEIGPTASVQRGRIERIVVASGTIEPEDLVEVRSRVSGIIRKFHVDAGDHVRAGQVVAELDSETLVAAVREARAVVHEAQVACDQAGLDLNRRRALFARGVESKDVLEREQAAEAGASARLERARATLERLEQELAYATIAAPIDGVVLERTLNAGAAAASVASVTGGTVLMTIADTKQMHLLGIVDENEIARVEVGMPARLRTEAYSDRVFNGRVRKIGSIGQRKNNVTSFQVEVTVLDGIEAMRPRMSADADIIIELREQVLLIPEAALLYKGDEIAAEVVDPNAALRLAYRPLRVGISNQDQVEVLDGLREGEQVKLQ